MAILRLTRSTTANIALYTSLQLVRTHRQRRLTGSASVLLAISDAGATTNVSSESSVMSTLAFAVICNHMELEFCMSEPHELDALATRRMQADVRYGKGGNSARSRWARANMLHDKPRQASPFLSLLLSPQPWFGFGLGGRCEYLILIPPAETRAGR